MKKEKEDVSIKASIVYDSGGQVIRAIDPRIKINTEQKEAVQNNNNDSTQYNKKIEVLTDERNRLEEQRREGHTVQDGIIKTWMSLRIKELEELASKENKELNFQYLRANAELASKENKETQFKKPSAGESLWRQRYSESEYDRISVGQLPTYVLKGH